MNRYCNHKMNASEFHHSNLMLHHCTM